MYNYNGLNGFKEAERISTRIACPHCGNAGLTGRIKRTPVPKLDNGDPEFRQYTICSVCRKYVFVINDGMQLEPGIYNEN